MKEQLMNLDKYLAGAKLAGGRLILQAEAAKKTAEDCVVLVTPKSEWIQLKKEAIDGVE